jgi:hypothetical protein
MRLDLKPARGVVQVNHRATPLLGNHAHRLVEGFAAMAISGKKISRRATRVNAHQHGMGAGRPQLIIF